MKKLSCFSLIELSIALVVLGFVSTMSFKFMRNQQRILLSQKREAELELSFKSLGAFYAKNCYLPKPLLPTEKNGILYGTLPRDTLSIDIKNIKYSVDERLTDKKLENELEPADKFCVCDGNRFVETKYMLKNDIIAFVLERGTRKVKCSRNNFVAQFRNKPCQKVQDFDNRVMYFPELDKE